jgi:FtsZ-binding cell division protein ZapB
MSLLEQQDTDSLTGLEERIHRTVQVVTQLRQEKEALLMEKQAAQREAAEVRSQAAKLAEELDALRVERKQVRSRIEKLLAQIDQLSNL